MLKKYLKIQKLKKKNKLFNINICNCDVAG